MNFDAARFDLDGTLLDTAGTWESICKSCLGRRGLDCPPDYVAAVNALSFREAAEYTVSRFGLDEPPGRLLKEWDGLALEEYARNVRFLPGARDYLSALRGADVRLAVATSLPERLSIPCLERLGALELFELLLSTDEVGLGKSHPDIFLLAAARLGIRPSACAVFDDTLPAIRAAKLAGMRAVAVLSPCSGPAAWLEREADLCLDSLYGGPVPGELWDLYDKNRAKTGLTMRRGSPVPQGLYHLSASGWIRNGRGQLLLTRRAAGKIHAHLWECTGGCVRAGEDSFTAILREIREELGLPLSGDGAKLIYQSRRESDFYDAWLFPAPDDMPPLVLQSEEVSGAKWVYPDELGAMLRRGELHPLLDYCAGIKALIP